MTQWRTYSGGPAKLLKSPSHPDKPKAFSPNVRVPRSHAATSVFKLVLSPPLHFTRSDNQPIPIYERVLLFISSHRVMHLGLFV